MSEKVIEHHYTECGLPNVWLEVFCGLDDAGEETIIIPKVGLLHKLISRDVVMSGRALSGPEIAFLREEMELAAEEFASLLGRRRATIARWEKGAAAPCASTDARIRSIAAEKLQLNQVPNGGAGEWKYINGSGGRDIRLRGVAKNPGDWWRAA